MFVFITHMRLFILLFEIRPKKTWNRHIHWGGFIFVHGGFITLNALFIYELWILQPHLWIRHMFSLHVTLFIAGFISDSALFMFMGRIPPFAKRIRIFFNAIRQLSHESATFLRKNSRLPLLDISKSVLFLPYSFADMAYSSIFEESALFQNESASVENESATPFLGSPPFFNRIHLFLWWIHFFTWRIHFSIWLSHHFLRVRHDY